MLRDDCIQKQVMLHKIYANINVCDNNISDA